MQYRFGGGGGGGERGRYIYIFSCGHGGRKERDDWKEVLERVEEREDGHHTLRDKCHVMGVKDHLWRGCVCMYVCMCVCVCVCVYV